MVNKTELGDAKTTAAALVRETEALDDHRTATERAVVRKFGRRLKTADGSTVLEISRELLARGYRWQAYELIERHPEAFRLLDSNELKAFGEGMSSWGAVDAFARTLSGPAWMKGQVPDELIHAWAASPDLWWRRAALVSTVALNMRSHGGRGDTPRTLAVCQMLAGDHEDMVVKGMSWALRELVVHDPAAVARFLEANDAVLAARVKREVRHKMSTGLKYPRRKRAARPEEAGP